MVGCGDGSGEGERNESQVAVDQKQHGKYAQFELPGKFMKVTYNDSLSDKSM